LLFSKIIGASLNDGSQDIIFTKEEEKEFNHLLGTCMTPADYLDRVNRLSGSFPNLYVRLFDGDSLADDTQKQMEFIKALEYPELVKKRREKRYRLKMLDSYICYDWGNDSYWFEEKESIKGSRIDNIYTQSEIDKMQELPEFKPVDLEWYKEEVIE
jgi:hypothetical protein